VRKSSNNPLSLQSKVTLAVIGFASVLIVYPLIGVFENGILPCQNSYAYGCNELPILLAVIVALVLTALAAMAILGTKALVIVPITYLALLLVVVPFLYFYANYPSTLGNTTWIWVGFALLESVFLSVTGNLSGSRTKT
jgi:hypothetical protein